ncbi:beta-galactosidase-1-like protein 3 [Diorhabda carinulata]|uniref:beta-galactosidase-1-like protein 3 n=1 Tax=Diorhabda carinulata TaxID=1163345 RepID=UPI0025A054D9|nr:beta-galactosidase-1-like protein 3 [Diorhabda carinulata]
MDQPQVMSKILIFVFLLIFTDSSVSELPTLYEYFTKDGIITGLSDNHTYFTLNNKNITIFSGALHYFRVPKLYWRDRLKKYRAAGLIAVETYVPWNLHEYQNGRFDFGSEGSDFEEFLNIVDFLTLAKEEDLFVILRPGPFIDSEWDFGGLPSWLLRYEGIKVRTSDSVYIKFVERYFKKLLELIKPLQFTKGGPIIALQIENEYGNTNDHIHPVDINYLKILKRILRKNGIVELLFTSDTPSNGFSGTIPGVLATANFQTQPIKELSLLKKFQPNKPLMVMEYWTGWFDHWTDKHHTRSAEEFGIVLEKILSYNASVNFYMFHGGTNWGFMNGAELKNKSVSEIDNKGFQPIVTTYDYDEPLSEAGDYTDKYFKVKELISTYNTLKIKQPSMPELHRRIKYPQVEIIGELSLEDIINKSFHLNIDNLLSMELLPINNNSGQSHGYIIYRKSNVYIPSNSTLQIEGRVCDTVLVLINGILKNKILDSKEDLINFGFWKMKDSFLHLGPESYHNVTLDIIVENWGRVNYGFLEQFNQFKGLWQGNVTINKKNVHFNEIIPL